MLKRIEYKVKGRVQGVGYRYFCQTQLSALPVTGWVRNEPDGSVCLQVQGAAEEQEKIKHLLEAGPSFSKVTEVLVCDMALVDGEEGFLITY